MKVSKGKSKQSKNNSLYAVNQTRKRLAGKPGSKYFMDPNKVFIGNLPFTATASDVEEFLKLNLGGLQNVESVKIITDWKTGKSKGYGFVQFMEPIFATSAMELIKGKKLMGRVIRLDQGKKKDDDERRILFVKKRERLSSDLKDGETEEGVIDAALDEVEGLGDEYSRDDEMYDDDDDDDSELRVFQMGDFDDQNDSLIFGDELEDEEDFDDDDNYDESDDNDDDEVDGWFEDFYGGSKWEELSEDEAKTMNRAQRREAQRMKPKKKLPHKGFGDYVPKTPPPENF
jgi:RNA recognition motif-containing protein